MTVPGGSAPPPRRSRRPDVLTLLLAAILVGGLVVAAVGAGTLAGAGGAHSPGPLVELPPTLPPDPGAALGPTGSPPPSPAATPGPPATPGASGPASPEPTPTATPSPTTGPSPAPSEPATPAAGYPSISDAVAAALDRMAIAERFAGPCDGAPADTICGGQRGQVGRAFAWTIGYTGTDFLLGTVVVREDAGGWHPVLFDPGTLVGAGPAKVGGTGGCLPLRAAPARDATQLACLPEGSSVRLAGEMSAADGYLWAAAEGGGWLPARWLCGPACEGVPNTVWSFEPGS
jgi:hypothetical protein